MKIFATVLILSTVLIPSLSLAAINQDVPFISPFNVEYTFPDGHDGATRYRGNVLGPGFTECYDSGLKTANFSFDFGDITCDWSVPSDYVDVYQSFFTDEEGVPPDLVLRLYYGCMDSEASNYDPTHTTDTGACEYDPPTPTGSMQISTTTCSGEDPQTCITEIDPNIAIAFMPIFIIIFLLVVMIMIKLFNFNNPWKQNAQ